MDTTKNFDNKNIQQVLNQKRVDLDFIEKLKYKKKNGISKMT